jgi:hypothetical protein
MGIGVEAVVADSDLSHSLPVVTSKYRVNERRAQRQSSPNSRRLLGFFQGKAAFLKQSAKFLTFPASLIYRG